MENILLEVVEVSKGFRNFLETRTEYDFLPRLLKLGVGRTNLTRLCPPYPLLNANEEEDELPEAGHDVAPNIYVDEVCEEAVPDKPTEISPNEEEDELPQAGNNVAPNGKLDEACKGAVPDEPNEIAPNEEEDELP